MISPRVSVLVPVFDAASTLSEALECVAEQTLADHEVVVVLDGCTDGSAAIARTHAAADDRVRVIEQAHAGVPSALGRGLRACRAPLVARHDADDLMLPTRLARQVAALEAHPEWTLVACGVRCEALPGAALGAGMVRHAAWLDTLATPAQIRAARFIDAPVAHPSVMFRRAAVVAAGGYRDGPFPEDYELWLRLLEAAAVFGRVPETLVVWRDGPGRVTRTDPRCDEAAHRRLKHRYLLSGPLAGGVGDRHARGARRVRMWGAGPFGKRHARELIAAGVRVDDVIDIDPRKIGGRVAGQLPVVAAESLGPPDGRLVLLAVGSRGARELIEGFLRERGYEAERDYLALQ